MSEKSIGWAGCFCCPSLFNGLALRITIILQHVERTRIERAGRHPSRSMFHEFADLIARLGAGDADSAEQLVRMWSAGRGDERRGQPHAGGSSISLVA